MTTTRPLSPVAWNLQPSARVLRGYVRGLRQPTLLLTLNLGPGDTRGIHNLRAVWAQEPAWVQVTGLPPPPPAWHSRPDDTLKAADWLLHWTCQIQRCAGLPVFEPGILLGYQMPHRQDAERSQRQEQPAKQLPSARVTLLVTTAHGQPQPALDAFKGVLAWFNQGIMDDTTPPGLPATNLAPPPGALEGILSLRKRLQAAAPPASNTPRFLQAAHEMGLPVIPLGYGTYQFGQGRRGRWLDSSITDVTPNIAVKMARDKAWAASRLHQAGIPVPPHRLAADADQAARIAEQLGFPVVVKPADQDGGIGVAAGLESIQEVRAAFAQARASSTRLLVEKQIPGRDYRLTVHSAQLVWAIERQPGGVTGDGVSTLAQLLERTNADPRRGAGPHALLKHMAWDDEARTLAAKAGLAAQGIPPLGQFVRLRRTANIATGGTPIAVFGAVHPDNAALAIRATRALRLDLAGVDLLIPDIARSWRETGAAVCEVNAQPQLGAITAPHLYQGLLSHLVAGNGRIPLVVIFGARPGSRLAERIAVRLAATDGGTTGWSDERGVAIERAGERQWLTARREGSFAAAQMLLTHEEVDRIVWSLNDDETTQHGLPFDRCHLLILAGRHLVATRPLPETGSSEPPDLILVASLAAILRACTGVTCHLTGSGLDLTPGISAQTTSHIKGPLKSEELLEQVVALSA